MKRMVRLLSLILALCMIGSVLPFGAFADGEDTIPAESTEPEVCSTCQKTLDQCGCGIAAVATCDKTGTCEAEIHEKGCPKTCIGCADGAHTASCPLYVACTAGEDCPGTVHAAPCAKACQQYDGCAEGTHSSDCCLFVCPECKGMGKNHTETCPTRCTTQEGCGDGKHGKGCPLYAAVCDGTAECEAATHNTGCPRTCLGGEVCVDGVHTSECPLYLCPECGQKPCACEETEPAPRKQLSSIAVTTLPTKTSYILGEALDVTGGKLTLTYDDSSTEDIDLTSQMVTGYDKDTAGEQTLTVTYQEKTTTYQATVAQQTPVEPVADTDMFIYMDAFDGNGVWTCWDDVAGMDFYTQLKYGNPENPENTQILNMDMQDLVITQSRTDVNVIAAASAEPGNVHYSLQNVGYADLTLRGSNSSFRINVHKFISDQFLIRGSDGTLRSGFFAAPGTYTMTFGVTSWSKTGHEWTPEDDVFTAVEPDVTSGSGVTMVKNDDGSYTVTIAEGGSVTLSANVNGTAKTLSVADVATQPITVTLYTNEGPKNFTAAADLSFSAVAQNPFPLNIVQGMGNPLALNTLSAEPADVLILAPQNGSPGNVILNPQKPGAAKVFYTRPGTSQKQLLFTVEIREGSSQLPPGSILYNNGGSIIDFLHQEPGRVYTTVLYVVMPDGNRRELNPDTLYATSDLIQIQRVNQTSNQVNITVQQGANGYIRYAQGSVEGLSQNQWFPLPARSYGVDGEVGADYQANLLICDPDGTNPRGSIQLKTGESITVSFRYGGVGASIPVTELLGKNQFNAITLTDNQDGTFTITADSKKTGTDEIGHMDACDGNGAKVEVVSVKAEDKMLFHKVGTFWGIDIHPYLDITAGQTIHGLQLYYGDNTASELVTEITADGNITITQAQNGGFDITAGDGGTGLLEYTRDGVVYTMSVRIQQPGSNGNGGNYEARNAITIGDTTYATAQLNQESLEIQPNFGADYEIGSTTSDFSRHIVLAAMGANGDVNGAAFQNISDVSVKLLTCVDEYDDVTPNTNARISARTSPVVPQTNGATTAGAVIQAEARKGFHSQLAISFTLKDGSKLRRCTVIAYVSYVSKAGSVVIYANDLDSAAKLNVVLSSYEAFLNWMNDSATTGAQVNGNFELGGNITLILPAKSYTDGMVVAQMVSDVVQNSDKTPISHMNLQGSNSGTTQLAGMLHKGGISTISNIAFVANQSSQLSYGDDSFSCGILADYTYETDNGFPWDAAYAQKYCTEGIPETMAAALEATTDKLNGEYNGDLRYGSVEIYNMNNCSFTGYDYGVRSTANGMVGSGHGNRFTNCFFGIYMDSYGLGVSKGNPHNTDYNRYTFVNNVFPVRLVSLPGECSPYHYRVHDSDFIHNLREFWITPGGNYYFYRNYYGGYWKANSNVHWKEFLNHNVNQYMDKWDNDKTEGNRPGRYHKDGSNHKANVITSAGKKVSGNGNNSGKSDGYWIYGREDQINWILSNEDLPIDQQAIAQLQTDTEVSVVNVDPNGNTQVTAVITFQGKGGDAA